MEEQLRDMTFHFEAQLKILQESGGGGASELSHPSAFKVRSPSVKLQPVCAAIRLSHRSRIALSLLLHRSRIAHTCLPCHEGGGNVLPADETTRAPPKRKGRRKS